MGKKGKKKDQTPGTETESKPRKKTAWREKQAKRIERALKSLTKLTSVLTAAKAPNVEPSLAQNALVAVTTLNTQIGMLPADWKPAKGAVPGTSKKIGIGSHIEVKADLGDDPSAATYKYMDKALFTNAEVVADDGRYWIVKCADGQSRVVKKKHVLKHVPVETTTTAVM